MNMSDPNPVLVESSRGGHVEKAHRGAIAVVSPSGAVDFALGDIARRFLPRSSCKILQALPLVESGAADAHRLDSRRLALACASHQGADMHAHEVTRWLGDIGLSEADLMCGPQIPDDKTARHALRAAGAAPDQTRNNCSGKHAGFLTLATHIGAGAANYVDPAHGAMRAVTDAYAETTGSDPEWGYGVDGCSAPNYMATITGLARAMAAIARPGESFGAGVRAAAAARLRDAMATYPELVAGEGRACTDLIRACEGRAVVKTGADGAFTAILIDRGLGVAIKIDDGDTAAAGAAMAAVLARYGAVDPKDPRVARHLAPEIRNRRDLLVGETRVVAPVA